MSLLKRQEFIRKALLTICSRVSSLCYYPARLKKFDKAIGVTHKIDKANSLFLAKFGFQMDSKRWTSEAPEVRKLK
ncbi:hypothetical protein C0J08_08520 [Marinomonas sp. CT5]|nr:hypothetical protein C0J08_08520 [Marinomonas sp. CT5]